MLNDNSKTFSHSFSPYRVSKNISFSFTLKTDDDCFIDIESILKVTISLQFFLGKNNCFENVQSVDGTAPEERDGV